MDKNKVYRIEVEPYMTKRSTTKFDFMKKFNGDVPMPSRVMTGKVLSETPKMVKMKLWDKDKTWEGFVTKSGIRKAVDISEVLETIVPVSISYGKTVVDLGESLAVKERAAFLLKRFPSKDSQGNKLFFSPLDFTDICEELENLGIKVDRRPGNFLDLLLVKENTVGEIEAPAPQSLTETELFPYQVEGISYGLSVKNFLLGDEMGLGKTLQSILIAAGKKKMYGFKHCLIICGVNTVKPNWVKEAEKHTDLSGWVLADGSAEKLKQFEMLGRRLYTETELEAMGKRDRAKAEKLNAINQAYFLVTNTEAFRNEAVTRKVEELCRQGVIGGIIFDEIHKCVNAESKQAQNLLRLHANFKIGLTGTPLINRPTDSYFIFKWLEKTDKDVWLWNGTYQRKVSEYEYESRNLDILKKNFERIMLRREKKNVLNLPEKIYEEKLIEMNEAQAKLYQKVLGMPASKIKNGAVRVTRLRQVTGIPEHVLSTFQLPYEEILSSKLEVLLEAVQQIKDNGQKVLIFSNWTEALDLIEAHLGDVLRLDGSVSKKERQEIQDLWQSEEEYSDIQHPVLIGTIKVMGTGLNLQTASNVIFFDEPWTNVDKEQAVDRCHRPGIKRTVNVLTLITKGTVDEGVHDVVTGKKTMAEFLLDYDADPEDMDDDVITPVSVSENEALSDCEIEMLM